jgi:rapamycin-insensitive companion of mTOR
MESLSKSADLFERMRHDSVGSANDANGSYNYYFEHLRDTTSLGGGETIEASKERAKRSTLIRQKVLGFFEKFKENELLIRDSRVLIRIDPYEWDWDTIVTIFRNKNLSTKLDENQLRFIKALTQYFKPSSNKFSHMELGLSRLISPNVHAGVLLIDYLLEQIDELEYLRILTDYCSDISTQLQAIYKKKAHVSYTQLHNNYHYCISLIDLIVIFRIAYLVRST